MLAGLGGGASDPVVGHAQWRQGHLKHHQELVRGRVFSMQHWIHLTQHWLALGPCHLERLGKTVGGTAKI